MNKWIGIGNICNNLELRYTANDIPIIKFSIAINHGFGEEKKTDFINCMAWRRLAENIAKYCAKGSKLAIEGHIHTESYEGHDGQRKYKTVVVSDNVTFLGSSKQIETTQPEFKSNQEALDSAMQEDPFMDFGSQIELSDDDGLEIPF